MMPMPWGRSMRAAYGKVIIGNIIPVMVLSPLSIMLLRMEGMGSGGEGLDVEIRSLWEAFRTFLIWVIQFIVFYTFKTNDTLYPYRLAGEEWVNGSYLKAVGFIILIFGICCYHKLPKYPCFNYEEEEEVHDQSETTCENAKVALSPLIDEDEPPKINHNKDEDSVSSEGGGK